MSLGRPGLQCSGVFMVVSTLDPGLQELQRFVYSVIPQVLNTIKYKVTYLTKPGRLDILISYNRNNSSVWRRYP
ncbi:hypothetical protein SFRURICE_019253 [Spodoptera frugiperda]|uniref:SFRICE_026034 n=1 Tax=Spodoptera frugiperda TaxID=7108 RepID=A0A2H1W171_SPOFR|nr:hypothetical protein SFRURICE_019253 [Spodoptera frugiperda]